MKRFALLAVALAVVVAAVIAAASWFFWNPQMASYLPAQVRALLVDGGAARAGTSASTAPARAAQPVETAAVEVGRVEQQVEALGTLAANETVVIAPEIAGVVTKLGFGEGEPVAKGQVLIELDASILRTELTQAQAELRLAKDTFERSRQLVQRGAGTQVALEQATATLAIAEAKIANVQARLEKTTLAAPFDGVVGLRNVAVGTYVTVGQNLVTLTDTDPIKVDFRVAEIFLGRVKDGQAIEITVDAIPGRVFQGRIYAIDPVIDVNGRAIRVRAQIANRDGILRPGLFARVTIVTDTNDAALLVPETAVFPDQAGKAVYVVEAGKARLTKVTTGKRLAGKVEVTSGLAAGMRVVTAGQMRLRDGAAIDIAPRQAGLRS
ncbi:efflux RND transporter periplasmic adaptor subunit [Xanthobacteraceae bacterium Astr-EGSB]|uniref:efflux RND transporter periplasmic adaptor subunit n=1 Tax=Astrobacterium formosum TaxID=3069710 RepID=UPI0027B2ACFB|nr:efflux RND transporter periplasmic adaptor subunit [Xanthobacteraceae bacterium Astr-EGSB]